MTSPSPLWLLASEPVFPLNARPTPECHAATLAQAPDGSLLAAWFAGTREGALDVGIWTARRRGNAWDSPREVANGIQYREAASNRPARQPCWNPALFTAQNGRMLLFFKVGPNPRDWWGEVMTSPDSGSTWQARRRLPEGILGPIKNKPEAIAPDTLLCPSSTEHAEAGWKVHFELCTPEAGEWRRTADLPGNGLQAIQPTLLRHPGTGRLQALVRTRRAGIIAETWSEDHGRTWSPLAATELPNPNSGIDAVTLDDGRFLLVYNPVSRGRTPLSLAISEDGRHWKKLGDLAAEESGEFSYPAVIQDREGAVHILFTWNRLGIQHAIVDPNRF